MRRFGRIHVLMQGRDWVGPEDIRAVAPLVLRHRIVRSYRAENDGTGRQTPDTGIEKILSTVLVPREWKKAGRPD